jgi:hypothetical protein
MHTLATDLVLDLQHRQEIIRVCQEADAYIITE